MRFSLRFPRPNSTRRCSSIYGPPPVRFPPNPRVSTAEHGSPESSRGFGIRVEFARTVVKTSKYHKNNPRSNVFRCEILTSLSSRPRYTQLKAHRNDKFEPVESTCSTPKPICEHTCIHKYISKKIKNYKNRSRRKRGIEMYVVADIFPAASIPYINSSDAGRRRGEQLGRKDGPAGDYVEVYRILYMCTFPDRLSSYNRIMTIIMRTLRDDDDAERPFFFSFYLRTPFVRYYYLYIYIFMEKRN